MKMTDVITRLRDVNPRLQEAFDRVEGPLVKAKQLVVDADRCGTDEGRKALISALVVEIMGALITYYDCRGLLKELDSAEKSYTRKFESEEAATNEEPKGPKQGEFDFTGSGGDDPTVGDGATKVYVGDTEVGTDCISSPADFVPQGEQK